MTTRTAKPDTLHVWQSPADDKWYCVRVASTGDVRMISQGYDDQDDAINCADACRAAAVIDTTIGESGRPEWLTYTGPRPRRRGRWLRRRR